MDYPGRWVFVTGGARGIGRGLVHALSASGYPIVFTYKSSVAEAQQVVAKVSAAGGSCEAHACDSACTETVFNLAKQLVDDHGPPYAVINNAGIAKDSLFTKISPEDWGAVLQNNLTSAYAVNRAFLPEMFQSGNGCIIHISSVTGLKGNIGQSSYAASKAAMIGMTRSLAVEVGRFNIRVNAVAPGLIVTDMTSRIPPAQTKQLIGQIALRRFGSVEDVARMVDFLLGPGGHYVTGQTFVVDGGLTA